MNKCFGIVSWLPDNEPARQQRKDRINRLFEQLNNLWPNIDILIITQNWQDFEPVKTNNKLVRVDYEQGLGILKARQTLRKEFLKLKYDYIIMFDDDAIINCKTSTAAEEYMQTIEQNPKGFSFIHDKRSANNKQGFNPYASAQLNLCAISKYIYKKEDIPNIDPQLGQGYEDSTYATLLHHKYAQNEFVFNNNIYCSQFQNSKEVAPSTWAGKAWTKMGAIGSNTSKINQFIVDHKELPNLELFFEYGFLVEKSLDRTNERVRNLILLTERARENEKRKRNYDGSVPGTYLYF